MVQDHAKSLMLLDKAKETGEVLKLMITILLERQRPRYFCSQELRGLPEAYQIEPRVTE